MSSDATLVARNLPLIDVLTRVKSPQLRREILRAGERHQLGKSICSICKNITFGTIKLKRRLPPSDERALVDLGTARLSRQKRDQIITQRGGAIAAAIPVATTVLPLAYAGVKKLYNKIRGKKKKKLIHKQYIRGQQQYIKANNSQKRSQKLRRR